jgi:hypothetical protein
MPVPPPVLLPLLLPWAVWMAHEPLSPLSFWVLSLRSQACCPYPTLSVAVPSCLVCLNLVLRTRSVMTTSPFLVYMSHFPGDLLLVPLPPRLQIGMMTFPVCIFQSALLWFCANVLLRAPLLPFPSSTSCPFLRTPSALQACGRRRCPLGYD